MAEKNYYLKIIVLLAVFFTPIYADIFDKKDENTIDNTIQTVTKNEKKYNDFSANLINVSHQSTLKQVLDVALQKDYIIKQAREKVTQMKYRKKEAEASYYPGLNANADYTRKMKYETGVNQNFFDEANGGLESRQMLFDGGVVSNNVERFDRLKKSENSKFHNTMMEQAQTVAKAYLGVVFDTQAVKVNIENMDKLAKILENVRIKVQSGAASMTEESSIAASFADANKTLVKAKSKLVDSINYFEYVTGVSTNEMMPYENSFPIQLSTFQEEFGDIEKNSPKLKSLKYVSKSKVSELNSAKAEYMPKLDLVSDLTTSQSMGGGDGYKKDGRIGVEATFKIFDGYARNSKIARIQSELRESIYSLEQERKKLKWDTEKLYNSVMTLGETLQTSRTELESREQQVEAYWNKFRLSTQDINVLLAAQKLLRDIKLDRLNYLKNRMLDYFKLLSFQDRLIEYFRYNARNGHITSNAERTEKETAETLYVHQSVITIKHSPDGLEQVLISVDHANLRGNAKFGNNIIGKAARGQKFTTVSKEGKWYKIKRVTKKP